MNQPGWQAVDSFATGGALQAVETAIANADLPGERFQSDAGGRALLLPARPLAEGEAPGITLTGAPAEAAELLFLDPADGATALSLLAVLGSRAGGAGGAAQRRGRDRPGPWSRPRHDRGRDRIAGDIRAVSGR